MQIVPRLFSDHPATVGETYFGHLLSAFSFGLKMIFSGFACLLHGLFPFLCVKTGSETVAELYKSMVQHRDKRPTDYLGFGTRD